MKEIIIMARRLESDERSIMTCDACMHEWMDSSKAKGTHIGFSSLWLDDHARARQASERTTSSSS